MAGISGKHFVVATLNYPYRMIHKGKALSAQTLFELESQGDFYKSPQPFLRWAGGKRRITRTLIQAFPRNFNPNVNRYFEPFIGGGALMFATGDRASNFYIPGKNIFINDSNPDLITAYKAIQGSLPQLIATLKKLSKKLSKDDFENIRKWNPKNDIEIAARFIYLNKTCFNGLWRVNSSGQFNVPWGKLKNPQIFDEQNLRACSARLRNARISNLSFEKSITRAREGDLVYFDPPYIPLSNSASFSQYSKENFNLQDHIKLAEVIKNLTNKGVYVVLSNSDTHETREIFSKQLTLRQVLMNRSISASSNSRTPVYELIGTNYKVTKLAELQNLKMVSKMRGELR
jgi:DNA adenine methylase